MRVLFLGICLLIFFSGKSVFAQEPMHFPVDPTPLVIMTSAGKVIYSVEIAKTPEQSEAGLMYRTDFPKNRAMLFIFPEKRIVTMWMANTPLPLDMVFLDEKGVIVSIAPNTTPYSTKIVSSHAPAAFTIELNAGDVQNNKIEIGEKVVHPAICGECRVD